MHPSQPPLPMFPLTATKKIVESDGFVNAEAKGQKEAQKEVALILERWADSPQSILDKKGNINPEAFNSKLKDFQSANGLTEDILIGRKTWRCLALAAEILEVQARFKPATRQVSSCNLEGLKNFKGFDCPQLEKFMAQTKPISPKEQQLMQNLSPLINLPWQRVVNADQPDAPIRIADTAPKPPRTRS